jgi:hypothetical protein
VESGLETRQCEQKTQPTCRGKSSNARRAPHNGRLFPAEPDNFMGLETTTLAAIVSAIATLLGAATASSFSQAVGESLFRRLKTAVAPRPEIVLRTLAAATPVDIARNQVMRRIKEASTFMEKSGRNATAFRWSGHFLTFGQYVIGGVLASSFVQQSLSSNIVGLFGVLVLIASLIKQQYQPEVGAQRAAQKAAQAKILIRDAEDTLAIIGASDQGENPAPFIELLKRISSALNRIDGQSPSASGKQLETGPLVTLTGTVNPKP